MTLRRCDLRLVFGLCAALALLVCAGILHSAAFSRNPNVIAGAVAFDLLITIPLFYYFCMVRTKNAAPVTLLPVFVAGLTAVKMLIPVGAQGFLQPILPFSAVLEVASLGLLGYRMYRRRGQAMAAGESESVREPGDWFERFSRRAKAASGGHFLCDLMLTEMAVFYYGVAGWFLRSAAPPSVVAFTCHRKSGWGTLLGVLIFLVVVEGGAVHVALAGWNVYAAWIWNAFDLYLILFLLADFQALRLRPSRMTDDMLFVRFGLRWSGDIPIERIASVTPLSAKDAALEGPDYLKMALLSDPEFRITLEEPVAFSGLLGRKKAVKRIGVRADDTEIFVRLKQIVAERAAPDGQNR